MTRARNSANLASHGNLFVDIANDRTGIGSVAPGQNLHVAGTAGFHADVTLTGDLYNATWDRSDNSLNFVDNAKIKIGTGGDLSFYHNGSNSYVKSSTGNLWLGVNNYLNIAGGDDFGTYTARFLDGGAVELYHNHSKKFETTAYGTNTTGTAVNDGLVVAGVATVTTMNVTGVLTYDDVTSVDSVGIVTARQGIHIDDSIVHIGDTNTKIRFPEADAVTIETNGSERFRINSSGAWGIGAAYGSSGQVLTSGGSGSSPSWTTITGTTINSNADNRIITGSGTANTLNGESNLTFNGNALTVTNSSSNTAAIFSGAGGAGFIAIKDGDDSTIAYIGVDGGKLKFQTSGSSYSDKLVITTGGVVSVGNQPKSWHSAYKVLQVGAASLVGQVEGDGTTSNWSNNAYFDTTNSRWEYSGAASDQASQITQTDGIILFKTAAAGTADNALTWAETLRITSGGQLLLGTSSGGLATGDEFVISTTGHTGMTIRSGSSGEGNIFFGDSDYGASGIVRYDHSANAMIFKTNAQGTDKLTITSTGLLQAISGQHDGGLELLSGNNNQSTRLRLQSKSSGGTAYNWYLDSARSADRFTIHDGSTSWFTILGTGKIGINETSPTAQLEIASTSYPETTEILTEFKAGVANGNRYLNRYIKLTQTYTGSAHGAIPIVWEANADGSNNKSYGSIGMFSDGAITFYNRGAGAAANVGSSLGMTEKLRIGNDGILVTYGTGAVNAEFNTTNGSGAYIQFDLSASGATTGFIGAGGQLVTGAAAADFGIRSQGNMVFSSGGSTERVRITSSGHVQIKSTGSATTGGAPLYVGVTGKSSITYAGGSDDTACVRIEDEGSSDGYFHGLEMRSKRGGDVRLYCQDQGNDVAHFVIATDNSALIERARFTEHGLQLSPYTTNSANSGYPISTYTDGGTRFATHLATMSGYSGDGEIICITNFADHTSGYEMFSVRITGYWYGSSTGGAIDCVVGCYAGENNFYNATVTGTYPNNWRDNIKFAQITSGNDQGKTCIRLGAQGASNNCEIAFTDCTHGFSSVTQAKTSGWRVIKENNASTISNTYNGNPQQCLHRSNEIYNDEFAVLGSGSGELLTNRQGKGGTIMGMYQYTQMNQGANYNHLIRSPSGQTDLTDSYCDSNWTALISASVDGTSTVDTACTYFCRDNMDDNNSLQIYHHLGNSSSSSNRIYMVTDGGRVAWKMDHSGGYRISVTVQFLAGGKKNGTYNTADSAYGGN